jgi:hypothetical protein
MAPARLHGVKFLPAEPHGKTSLLSLALANPPAKNNAVLFPPSRAEDGLFALPSAERTDNLSIRGAFRRKALEPIRIRDSVSLP